MQKKELTRYYQRLLSNLLQKSYLRRLQLSQKALKSLLQETGFRARLQALIQSGEWDCESLLETCLPVMERLGEEPFEGWLSAIYVVLLEQLFPAEEPRALDAGARRGGFFYLMALRTMLQEEFLCGAPDPRTHFALATKAECEGSPTAEEYEVFTDLLQKQFLQEMMFIGRTIMPYDLLGHVAGVHHIAMHAARQLVQAGVAVDLPLVSAAAASHDIGKYGCKGDEMRRIPYLHYYYTEQWLTRYALFGIAHVAANHSTWDLELENLPAESLLLIYADFRVKSVRGADGKEKTLFYSLRESYDVILSKLDNVDAAKQKRYERVYAKLHDFEEYMRSLGVNPDPASTQMLPVIRRDSVLLDAEEAVQGLRFQAISHNLRLMRRISSDASFADLLEDARSEKDWKNIRTYIDIFEEYFTYMTQKQKMLTMRYLYELFMHSQGDIRAQAATLYGRILASYDVVYRKELPKDIRLEETGPNSLGLWRDSLEEILLPDHKLAPQHRAWINYTLKTVLPALFASSSPDKAQCYLQEYLQCFHERKYQEEPVAFVLLDSLLRVPPDMLTEAQMLRPLDMASALATSGDRRMQAVALRLCLHVLSEAENQGDFVPLVRKVIAALPERRDIAVQYLLMQAYNGLGDQAARKRICEEVLDTGDIADLFLENLKTATAWIIKEVNIQLLLYRVNHGGRSHAFQVATHLANLIRVSERFAVRHAAGNALVRIAPLLTLDQRNEIAVELTRGLENASYEFSKYIPQYLGRFLLSLHPKELDEVLREFEIYVKSSNELAACVTLPTLGVLLQAYDEAYMEAFGEPAEAFHERRLRMLSMLMGGIAHYSEIVSRDAFLVIGKHIFGGSLTFAQKNAVFDLIHKKLLMLLDEQNAGALQFFNNAASLNHIYRYIIDAHIQFGDMPHSQSEKIAFFPGTFDPFSMSHKGIVKEIRAMGYDVFLALDEFSWSKRTQPHMVRRRIVNMSVADMFHVYLFPDDIPVNIANPADLERLRGLFPGKELYMAVGSDVILHASAYQAQVQQHTIHTFNHIVFLRNMDEAALKGERKLLYARVQGKIKELSLPNYLEDVSSTRIRDNIDHNRDISTLVDPVAQGYIYDNSFYLREPQYKQLLRPETVFFKRRKTQDMELREAYMQMALVQNQKSRQPVDPGWLRGIMKAQLEKAGGRLLALYRDHGEQTPQGIVCYYSTSAEYLFDEFHSVPLAEYARRHTSGRIAVLAGVYVHEESDQYETMRLLVTEALADCLKQDYTYALYIAADSMPNVTLNSMLEQQGFLRLPYDVENAPVYAVDMRTPIALVEDVRDRIKSPLSSDAEVLRVLQSSHKTMAMAMTKLYPGRLVLSFDSGILNHALIQKILRINKVEHLPPDARQFGECMCVPYGKPLHGVMVPNTVTKALHVDKTYLPDMKSFHITAYPGYSSLLDQVYTIKSFNRPALLVDDLLHKGYRLEKLDPLFKEAGVDVRAIVVGILSGRGKDLMSVQQRQVESVYFIPNLRYWFVESMLYPFLGGDSVYRPETMHSNLLPSVNQVYPYTSPAFISGAPKEALFDLSLVCLQNTVNILRTLERRHQAMFGFNLTINRLGEAIHTARVPDKGGKLKYDRTLSPSAYVENDIEQLLRLEPLLR